MCKSYIKLYANRVKVFAFCESSRSWKRSILEYVMTESREEVLSPTMREVMRSVCEVEPEVCWICEMRALATDLLGIESIYKFK